MPSVFKSLTSLTVWILFIFGLLALIGGFARMFMSAALPMVTAYLGFGVVCLFLAAVVAKIRHGMG